jgi:hypothetical protein
MNNSERDLVWRMGYCEEQRNKLRTETLSIEKAIKDNDQTIFARLAFMLPPGLRKNVVHCRPVTRFKEPGVEVYCTENCWDGFYILADDEEGKRVTVKYTEPTPEKCASKSENPAPEPAEKEPLTEYEMKIVAEEEAKNQKARDLEKILNEPRAAQFRRCMAVRRAAAEFLSNQ